MEEKKEGGIAVFQRAKTFRLRFEPTLEPLKQATGEGSQIRYKIFTKI